LFAWDEEQAGECLELLTSIVLQVVVDDQWVWKLHSSQCYMVSSAYNNLTAVEDNNYVVINQAMWLKAVPLKMSLFVWFLLLNHVPSV